METVVPADVVSAVLAALRGAGFDARPQVPLDMPKGMVRVSRVGGDLVNIAQEKALILIECWDDNQPVSFKLARQLWGFFAAIQRENQDAFPGIVCYEAVPESMPIQAPDGNTRLERHQFTVSLLVQLERISK